MTDKGSETLETWIRKFEREFLYTPSVPGDEWDREMALRFAAHVARTVAREMIAEIRKEADKRAASHGELKTTTVCYLMNEASVETLREVANKFESSPRYGTGSSKVKPGEPTQ